MTVVRQGARWAPREERRWGRWRWGRWRACVAGLGVWLALAGGSNAGAVESWEQGVALRKAVARSRAGGRPLVLKLTRRWCPKCWQLEEVLRTPKLRRAAAWFVKLAYDGEAGEGVEVARRYNVVTFPTLLVIGTDGNEVGRVTGSASAAELQVALDRLGSGQSTLAKLEEQLVEAPANHTLRLRVGRGWALRGQREEAEQHLDQVIAADRNNARGLAAEAMLVRGRDLLLRSLGLPDEAEEVLRALRRRYRSAPQVTTALLPLARALHEQGKTADALALLGRRARTGAGDLRFARFALEAGEGMRVGLRRAQRAVKRMPRSTAAWLTLARLQERAGARDAAARSWERVAELAPGCQACRARSVATRRDGLE